MEQIYSEIYIAILLLAAWELAWKVIAMWYAAKRREYGWLVALLLINTIGILPIIYIHIKTKKCPNCKKRIQKNELGSCPFCKVPPM